MAGHRIILTGGGTGGHVYPALAVYEQLKGCPEVEKILYVGVAGHIEERLAAEAGLEFVGLNITGMPRSLGPDLVAWPFRLWSAVQEALKVLKLFRPTVVLGTGGYAAAPPLAAAAMLGVPYAIHEPDAHPGLVNRLFAGQANLISLGMEAAAAQLKPSRGQVRLNGNPVRESFINPLQREAACAVLGLDKSLKTILVTGGSQGAQSLNESLMVALPGLLEAEPALQIIHQSGEKNISNLRQRLSSQILQNRRYLLRPYFEDLSIAYAVSDLAVCRAGAMTIAELAASGTPALFVPYPFAAADHQSHNAQFLASKNAAVVLPQSKLTGQTLHDLLLSLLSDSGRLLSMRKSMQSLARPQAALALADQIKQLSQSTRKSAS